MSCDNMIAHSWDKLYVQHPSEDGTSQMTNHDLQLQNNLEGICLHVCATVCGPVTVRESSFCHRLQIGQSVGRISSVSYEHIGEFMKGL